MWLSATWQLYVVMLTMLLSSLHNCGSLRRAVVCNPNNGVRRRIAGVSMTPIDCIDWSYANIKLQAWRDAFRNAQLQLRSNSDMDRADGSLQLQYMVDDSHHDSEKRSIKVIPFLKSKNPSLSTRQIEQLCKAQAVLVNGKPTFANSHLYPGYNVQLHLPAPLNTNNYEGMGIPSSDKDIERLVLFANALLSASRNPALKVLFEDDQLAVVCKPAGVHSMPWVNTLQRKLFTLQDALPLLLCPPGSSAQDVLAHPSPCHRLDARVSGCVLVAKTLSSLRSLSEQFASKVVEKDYYAVLTGHIDLESNRDLVQSVRDGVWKVSSVLQGRRCDTELTVLEEIPHSVYGHVTFVKLKPCTGRKHQLRQHCALLGCPIVGDQLYHSLLQGSSAEQRSLTLADIIAQQLDSDQEEEEKEDNTLVIGVKKGYGMLLSSTAISFQHPDTKLTMKVDMDLPPKFDKFLTKARVAHQWELDNLTTHR